MATLQEIANFGQGSIASPIQAYRLGRSDLERRQARQAKLAELAQGRRQASEQEERDFTREWVSTMIQAPPEQRASVYQGGLQEAQRRGYDLTGAPNEYTEDTLYQLAGAVGAELPSPTEAERGRFVGSPVRVRRGEQTFLSGVQQLPSGEFARVDVPLEGELLSITGETPQQMTQRELEELERRRGIERETAAGIEREKALGKQTVETAGEFFDQARKVRAAIPNYNQAIEALDEGANTGRVMQMLPSFKAATQKFENAANRLGLDVIGSVTFGALSEGELRLAMETAVPRGMQPDELKQYLMEKRDAQEKLARYLEDAAIFFGRGGTQAEWLEQGRGEPEQSVDIESLVNKYAD